MIIVNYDNKTFNAIPHTLSSDKIEIIAVHWNNAVEFEGL